MYEYVTFERQYGSGGQEIATKLAKRLGYQLYDRGVLVETCKRMDVDYAYISKLDETAPSKLFFRSPGSTLSLEEQIFETEKVIIREAAEKPGCIFVGRCAGEVLKDKKVLRVFVTAEDEYRLERAVSVENVSPDDAEGQMRKIDKRREKFFNAHAGNNWRSPEFFDIILNSGRLGIDACVDLLEDIIRDKEA
ncbi:MAG: cytidylate kinase-like family protein [Lachnospiraceae bacterium]|nr:cytidylate kinase-like family protein [Lachnospiraceae bacterium]